VPQANAPKKSTRIGDLEVVGVERLRDAIDAAET
jgi:hypothetical protein